MNSNTIHSNTETVIQPTRSRFHPATWNTSKRVLAATLATVFVVGGWAAFRPEKLFVNETVSEKLASGTKLVSQGNFSSLAHHTEGSAQLYKAGNSYSLRLAQFSTSNGPDVHVYATQKAGIDNAAIKNGEFLDLGVIKGNIGDQNYALPASFDPAKYEGISIWCKRFGVNFAGASFSTPGAPKIIPVVATQVVASKPAIASSSQTKDVTVTTGLFRKVGEGVKGRASITENLQGARTLTLSNFSSAKGPDLHVYLVKAENVKDSAGVGKAGFIDLGKLKSLSGTQTYSVPKNIDLWQYLSVVVWCDKFKVNFATAPLASPQS